MSSSSPFSSTLIVNTPLVMTNIIQIKNLKKVCAEKSQTQIYVRYLDLNPRTCKITHFKRGAPHLSSTKSYYKAEHYNSVYLYLLTAAEALRARRKEAQGLRRVSLPIMCRYYIHLCNCGCGMVRKSSYMMLRPRKKRFTQ